MLWFDDVSFLRGGGASRGQVEHMKQAMTVIRHVDGGRDVKTIVGLNYHYSKSMDVYLRDTHFKIWTSLLPEELKNAQKMLPSSRHRAVASRFQKYYALSAQGKDVRVVSGGMRGRKTTVTYKYNNPFRLAMFSDNNGIRLFVYPADKVLVGKCGVCRPSEYLADPKATLGFLRDQFGRNNFAGALRVVAMKRWGVPVYNPGIRAAVVALDRLQKNGAIDDRFLLSALQAFQRGRFAKADANPTSGYVPADVRNRYLALTGIDGLRATSATEKTLDAAADADK